MIDEELNDLLRCMMFPRTKREHWCKMVPLYVARFEDRGPGRFRKGRRRRLEPAPAGDPPDWISGLTDPDAAKSGLEFDFGE
jgi:hypothetical protein